MTYVRTRKRVRQRGAPLPEPEHTPGWYVSHSVADVDEGGNYNVTVGLNLNGYVPAPGETASITFTTGTDAEFNQRYPGETQAKSGNGDFQSGYTSAFKNAIEALGGTANIISGTGYTYIELTFKISSFLTCTINRITNLRPGDNGPRRTMGLISSPTIGEITGEYVSTLIEDVSEPPAAGDIVSGALTANRVAVPTPAGVNVAINTRIGQIQGFDAEGDPVVLSAVTLSDNVGGRFKITQETTNFFLDVASADINFRDQAGLLGKPIMFYAPQAQLTSGGITIPLVMSIEPIYFEVNPTGGTGTPVSVTSAAELEAQFTNTTPGKVVQVATSLIGVTRNFTAPRDITITIGTPTVIDWGASGPPSDNTEFVLTTTGALPTGLTNGGYYYVCGRSGTTSKLCATRMVNQGAGWIAQPFVNTSGTQSGTHSAKWGTAGTPKINRSGMTWVGHKRFAMNRGKGVIFNNGTNIVCIDMAWRVGPHLAMAAAPQIGSSGGLDVDNWNCGDDATLPAGWIWFINNSFSHSNDELVRLKNGTYYPRGARFTNCLFAEACSYANHEKGTYHPLGPACSPGTENMLMEFCLLIGLANRMPNMNRSVGMTVRNNIMVGWSDSTDRGASQITQSDVGSGYNVWTGRIQANLYDAVAASGKTLAQHRAVAIQAKNIEDASSVYAYVPSTGNYRNHHIRQAIDKFTDDPLVIGDGIYIGANPSSMIKDRSYYGLANEAGIMPTSTEAERRALWARVMNYVGVRSRTGGGYSGVLADAIANNGTGDLVSGDNALNYFDYDVVHGYRTTGIGRTTATGPTAAMVDGWYGKGWNGGGSLIHGMCDVVS